MAECEMADDGLPPAELAQKSRNPRDLLGLGPDDDFYVGFRMVW